MNFDDIPKGTSLQIALHNLTTASDTPVVVGTLCFALHGALPWGYEVGDIDILLFSENVEETQKSLYKLYAEWRETIHSSKELKGASLVNQCYIYQDIDRVRINVWLKPIRELSEYNVQTLIVSNEKVKTISLRQAIWHKRMLGRDKDIRFIHEFIKQII